MINCAPRFNLYPFAIAALPSSPPVIFMAYKHVGWLCWTSHLKSTTSSSFSSPVLKGQGTERETIYLSGEYIEMLTEERQSCPLCAAAVVVPVTGEPHPTAQHHDKINCRLVRRGRTCLFLFSLSFSGRQHRALSMKFTLFPLLLGRSVWPIHPDQTRGSHAMRWSLLMGQVEN